MKHSVWCSDPERASHLHTEGSSVVFLCAEEFRECIFGLHRGAKMCCSLRAGSAVVKLSLVVILSAGVSLVVRVVETGFPRCYWDSDLRSLKTVCTVHRKGCSSLREACRQTGESSETCRELAQRRIYSHSHWDGFLILLVLFALVCLQKSSPRTEGSVLLLFFLTTLKQSVGNQGTWVLQLLGLYLVDASGVTMLALTS